EALSAAPVEELDVSPPQSGLVLRVHTSDRPAAFFTGAVVDEQGLPIEGARIEPVKQPVSSFAVASPHALSEARTGAFKVGPLPAGTYRLNVSARGFAAAELFPLEIAKVEARDVGTVTLHHAGSVRIKLARAGGGPIGNVTVWIEAGDGGAPRSLPIADG